jgi:hypothetical protein
MRNVTVSVVVVKNNEQGHGSVTVQTEGEFLNQQKFKEDLADS